MGAHTSPPRVPVPTRGLILPLAVPAPTWLSSTPAGSSQGGDGIECHLRPVLSLDWDQTHAVSGDSRGPDGDIWWLWVEGSSGDGETEAGEEVGAESGTGTEVGVGDSGTLGTGNGDGGRGLGVRTWKWVWGHGIEDLGWDLRIREWGRGSEGLAWIMDQEWVWGQGTVDGDKGWSLGTWDGGQEGRDWGPGNGLGNMGQGARDRELWA